MNRTEKEQIVAELSQKLSGVKAAFIADYRGINVDQVTRLRRELLAAGVDYRVVKNSLLRLSAKGSQAEVLESYCKGPTAIAMAGTDVVTPAKILVKYADEIAAFDLKAGMLDGKLIDVDGIKALSKLPSREELLAKALSSMNAPASNLVGTLAAIPRSLVQVLNAIGQSKAA
jgi:large subunit ribosomal protein L10